MTETESFDLELRVLHFVAKSVMPRIDDWSACAEDGRILGTVFYGGLGTIVADAFERREALDRVVPALCAIVEYAAAGLQRSFELWAPALHEFFESLEQSPEANAWFARIASEDIRGGAARLGWTWARNG
ncbi:MAG TPA: hypothetical protein VK665_14375 [Candidatus Elarobacter sp.]|nr:hypothetical protein [Candidatus Elarobacter sp.]